MVIIGGVMVSMLAIGSKVGGFKPCQGQWIFEEDKNLLHALEGK
jgi:hypothetical protein